MSDTDFKRAEKSPLIEKNRAAYAPKHAPSFSNSDMLSMLGAQKSAPVGLRDGAEAAVVPARTAEPHISAGGLSPMTPASGLSAAPIQAKKDKKDENKQISGDEHERDDMLADYGSRDNAGKVKLLSKLNALFDARSDLLESPLYEAYDGIVSTLPPELIKELITQRSTLSSKFVTRHGILKNQNRGIAQRNKNGVLKTQDQADSDYASMQILNSSLGDEYDSYESLLMFTGLSGNKTTKNAIEKYRAEAGALNPDMAKADHITDSSFEPIKYTYGDEGDEQVRLAKQQRLDRERAAPAPWKQRKKAWWHFW